MIIERRQKLMYSFTCYECHTALLLDETDFKDTVIFKGTSVEIMVKYISSPCPVCGKVWNNVEQNGLRVKFIEI